MKPHIKLSVDRFCHWRAYIGKPGGRMFSSGTVAVRDFAVGQLLKNEWLWYRTVVLGE